RVEPETPAPTNEPARDFTSIVISARDGRVVFAQPPRFCAGVDDSGGWVWGADANARAPLDSLTESVLRGHELHMLVIAPETRWSFAGAVRDTLFRGAPAVAAHFRDALGAPALAFYARADSLPLGFVIANHSGRGEARIEVELADWRRRGDLRWFDRALFRQGAATYEHRYTSVRPIASITPADPLFAPRAAAAAAVAAEDTRHLIYLHGRIVQEQQSARPHHPEFGYYELDEILTAFRERGFVVSGEIRPKSATVSSAADSVVARVRRLVASGVATDRITVVGGSMGASIALLASARLQNPDVRFCTLGACLSENVRALIADEGAAPSGRVLAIRESSDELVGPCAPWHADADSAPEIDAREVVLNTGLSHGFLYRPLLVWVDRVAEWATADRAPSGPQTEPGTAAEALKAGVESR
ncbi:MAG: hypothetical protein ACKVU1_16390, partial [bacterium]